MNKSGAEDVDTEEGGPVVCVAGVVEAMGETADDVPVALVFTYPGARGPLPTIIPPPPLLLELPLEEEVVQTVAEGVMTLVTVPAPE